MLCSATVLLGFAPDVFLFLTLRLPPVRAENDANAQYREYHHKIACWYSTNQPAKSTFGFHTLGNCLISNKVKKSDDQSVAHSNIRQMDLKQQKQIPSRRADLSVSLVSEGEKQRGVAAGDASLMMMKKKEKTTVTTNKEDFSPLGTSHIDDDNVFMFVSSRISDDDGYEREKDTMSTCASTVTEDCPSHASNPNASESFLLEQLETGKKVEVDLSESVDQLCPRHKVGCTPHECHGAMMDKKGFDSVSNSYALSTEEKLHEAREFLKQFAFETGRSQESFEERMRHVEHDIHHTGTYEHTFEELEFGCRLAWRNSGRCIMRKVSFSLELRDCRHVTSAELCFDEIVKHLTYAANGGSIKAVISMFAPKADGFSSPVRIWNRQLLGYAAYQRPDGSIMGDPVNLSFTSLCVELGWDPPANKSDFDILPILISDETTGHACPKIFELPHEAVLEVNIEHPEHELFSVLNLRWYAIPAISNMGVDIGGIYYQTCPFNGWYVATEIGRDFLDRQRYDLAEAVAVACGIQRTKLSVWRDDAQLQMHKAILHSFSKTSTTVVDHHTASESFMSFYEEEIKKRRKCPADWVWLVPPAGGAMTSVFHQEMVNFIVKPQYRPNVDLCLEGPARLEPILVDPDATINPSSTKIKKPPVYEKVLVCYGSETGTSLRFASRMCSDLESVSAGLPIALNDLPDLLRKPMNKRTLVLVITSTFGKGDAPSNASNFLERMAKPGIISTCDYAVLALGNSAYTNSYAAFGFLVHRELEAAELSPVMTVHIADELQNQENSFVEWKDSILDEEMGVLFNSSPQRVIGKDQSGESTPEVKNTVNLSYQGFAQVIRSDTTNEIDRFLQEHPHKSWSSLANTLGRSTDLFSFKLSEDQSEMLNNLRPGDHLALYPENLPETVDLVMRLMKCNNEVRRSFFRKKLRRDIDLAKPVSTEALRGLWNSIDNDQAKYIIDLIIQQSRKDETDVSVEDLLSRLPPGSIPSKWIEAMAPKMSPRFFSIASISPLHERTVSICQSVYSFKNGQAGCASRWLRSLEADDEVRGAFSHTDLHLPKDEDAPILLVATGTGIAPFRSFWTSDVRNPMHLFFGCRDRRDLPFASEIASLQNAKRIKPFIAYSREINKKKLYVQDLIMQESDTILKLLHNSKTHVYICGSPVMEKEVRNKLLMVLSAGNEAFRPMKTIRAMEKLVIMKQQKRFVSEIYGTSASEDDAMATFWREITSKTVMAIANIEKLTLPRPRHEAAFKPVVPIKASWNSQFRPELSPSHKNRQSPRFLNLKKKKRGLEMKHYGSILNLQGLNSELQSSFSSLPSDILSVTKKGKNHDQQYALTPITASRRISWHNSYRPEFNKSMSVRDSTKTFRKSMSVPNALGSTLPEPPLVSGVKEDLTFNKGWGALPF